jgi:general L-amino acid transport system permease protein
MLIYDTRYRSMTIQVIAFILIMSGLVWLANNTVQNLRRPGQGLQFRLPGRAGGLRHQPAPDRVFQPDSPMGAPRSSASSTRSWWPFLGCITATDFGVVAGVLRLSSNWIVARSDVGLRRRFRNVPVLLWILIIFAIMTESMPAPVIPGRRPRRPR